MCCEYLIGVSERDEGKKLVVKEDDLTSEVSCYKTVRQFLYNIRLKEERMNVFET